MIGVAEEAAVRKRAALTHVEGDDLVFRACLCPGTSPRESEVSDT